MLLWVSISLLTLAVTAILVWPLLAGRAPRLAADNEMQRRVAVFRDRRDEIRADAAAGRLNQAQADQAQDDLLRQMTEELPGEWLADSAGGRTGPTSVLAGPSPRRTRTPLLAGIVVTVALPLLAFGVYRSVGAPEIALAQMEGRLATLADTPQGRFDALVAQIEARLRADPSDGEAWAVLAEAYKLIGNHGAAIEAFGKAVEFLPPNARLLADYAESTALAAGGDFSGRPAELLEQALATDPNDQKAVALMGAARYRAGDLPEARRYLGQLLASLPAGSAEAAQIGEVVARIETELGGALPSPAPAPSANADADADADPFASSAPALLKGTVTLAPSLAERLPSDATLFVVARAAAGPRIPLAVLRVPAASLPYEFELGDANAMDPSRPLSSADQLTLEARVSASGEAMRQAGDLYGQAPPTKAGAGKVAIVIDQVVGR